MLCWCFCCFFVFRLFGGLWPPQRLEPDELTLLRHSKFAQRLHQGVASPPLPLPRPRPFPPSPFFFFRASFNFVVLLVLASCSFYLSLPCLFVSVCVPCSPFVCSARSSPSSGVLASGVFSGWWGSPCRVFQVFDYLGWGGVSRACSCILNLLLRLG